ncbi:hypothetical protein ACFRMN_26130 [Streptomyces sp. NPDC056835]|uniref:hypothetical protein n=1 Tax=Streptomyces sp. NPDC056835 TaxID=3345956 RepID=UPI0036A1E9AD
MTETFPPPPAVAAAVAAAGAGALPAGHPHVRDAVATHGGWWHGHDCRIDTLHTRRPTPSRISAKV